MPGATQNIPVTILDDDVYSATNLTFSAALSSPSGAILGTPTGMTVTIIETDPQPAPVVTLEAPGSGTFWGSHVSVSGYAYDTHAMNGGTGIGGVSVFAYPNADLDAIPLGFTANYGISRSDVPACSGQFINCGFSLTAVLSTGTWLVQAQALDLLSGGQFYPSNNTKTFTVQPTPRMNVDKPANGGVVASSFLIGGWAIDAGASSGTGVDVVQVWAYPNPGSGQSPVFVGTATYGGSRPDVGAAFGSQFTPSGFGLSANLAAGYYQLVVSAHSTVTASWSQAQSVYVTVTAQIYLSVDTPANNTEPAGNCPSRLVSYRRARYRIPTMRRTRRGRSPTALDCITTRP